MPPKSDDSHAVSMPRWALHAAGIIITTATSFLGVITYHITGVASDMATMRADIAHLRSDMEQVERLREQVHAIDVKVASFAKERVARDTKP